MPKESLDTLISELTHEEDWRRMRATAACLAGGPKAVDGLIHALETGDAALKMEAAGMLARIKDPRGGVPLVRLLSHEDPAVRKAGAIALEQMAGILDTAAATALVQDLHEFKEDDQKQTVIGLLGVIPNSIQPLTAMLKHADEDARMTAATILEHLLDPRSADALVEAIADPVVQTVAVRTLKKLHAVRERIDQAFDALRNVDESNLREDARMSTVIEPPGDRASERGDPD